MIGPYLVDTVVLEMFKGSDEWQENTATYSVNVKAFIDYGEHRIQNASGEVVVSMAKILMRPRNLVMSGFASRGPNSISYKDKVTFDGISHSIVRINRSRDFSIRSTDIYVL